jgi:hypothetical protein
VVDRGEPVVAWSEWHADGMAGEHDLASHLNVEAPARRWVRPVRDDTCLVGKGPQGARQLTITSAVYAGLAGRAAGGHRDWSVG